MRTLVAGVAVAVVPVPVPVVVEAIAVERPLRRGPEPHVVVHLRQVRRVVGRLVVRGVDVQLVLSRPAAIGPSGYLPIAGPRLEAQAARHVDLADPAVLHELDRLDHRRPAAVHRADLHDLVVALRGVDHLPAFPHGVRRGLLDVDVLAGLQRPDGRERVPVVRHGDDDGVDVLVVEDAAEVLDVAGLERRDSLRDCVIVDRSMRRGSRRCRTAS